MPHFRNAHAQARFRIAAPALLSLALVLALLPGCQRSTKVAGGSAQQAEGGYPSLATVPPRPRLSYSVEQRRAIEGQLIGDRAYAAHRADVLDYETGRTAEPPAPPQPAPVAATAVPPAEAPPAAEPERRRGPGDNPAVEAYVRDAMARDEDEGKLKDFMRKLERPIPGAEPGASIAGEAGLATPPAAAGSAAGPVPSTALERFGSLLGGILGLDGPAAEPAAARVRIAFAHNSTALPEGAERLLAGVLARAQADGSGLRIAGGGPLAAERSAAVAAALGRLGAAPAMLDLAPAGAAEEVSVTLFPRQGV